MMVDTKIKTIQLQAEVAGMTAGAVMRLTSGKYIYLEGLRYLMDAPALWNCCYVDVATGKLMKDGAVTLRDDFLRKNVALTFTQEQWAMRVKRLNGALGGVGQAG